MPKVVPVEQKRREILRAAARTFARYGYRRTNLSRVAAAAGMGKSSLYHYFPTKEALFAALADDFLRREEEALRAAAGTDGDPGRRFERMLDVVFELFSEWVKVGPLVLDFLREPRGRRRLRDTFRSARSSLATLVREGQRAGVFRSGSPNALATTLLCLFDGLFFQELADPGSTRSRNVEGLLREVARRLLASEER